jgi:uncharacterized protein (TIGR02284 family)
MVTDREKKDAAALLNTLLQCCLDAHDGYQAASRHVDDMDVKRLFGHFALERKRFGEELGLVIESLGGTPRERGSVKGALHRGWIELAGEMDEPLRGSVLKECVRGEALSVRHYEDALARGLPPEARHLAERQLQGIREARDKVAALEAATAA